MQRVVVVVMLASCGRLHFDPLGVDGGAVGMRVAYIKPSTTNAGEAFGSRVAISDDGTTLAVSAYLEDSSATGIDGGHDVAAPDSGAVFVFRRTGATWAQEAYIKASNTAANDQFGRAVALSSDGTTLAVTANRASQTGAAYVFTRTGSTWLQRVYLIASNAQTGDDFGTSVALSGDGSVLAVSAFFESSAATGIGGNQLDNSSMHAGAVYVFGGPTWIQQAYIKASNTDANDLFGEAVALSNDGRTLAVGAPLEDSAATGIDGDQADNSMSEAGAAYVFTGPAWAQQAYVKSSNTHLNDPTGSFAQFGWDVSLSGDGNTLAVGARGEDSGNGDPTDTTAPAAGAVYTLVRTGATWSQSAYIKVSNIDAGDFFGETVALSRDGTTLAVTSPNEDGAATGFDGVADNAAIDSGAAYTFAAASWRQTHYMKQTNTGAGDMVSSIAISRDGSVVAIGAPNEDSAATGVDGDQLDNSVTDSGAVYIWY